MTHLTRDEQLTCQLLRPLNWEYQAIATHLHCSIRQASYAIEQGHLSLKKRSGSPPTLSQAQVEEIIGFISATTKIGVCYILRLSVYSTYLVADLPYATPFIKRATTDA